MKIKIYTILIILLIISEKMAFAGPGATGMDYLKIVTGARQAGMGGASVALGDDINTIQSNPSGLAMLNKNEVSFTHLIWFEDITYDCMSFVFPTKVYGTFGGGVNILRYGDIKGYDSAGMATENVSAYDLTVTLSAGSSVSWMDKDDTGLFAGASIKLVQERLYDKTATVIAIDAGGMYAPGLKIAGSVMKLGVCVENIGQNIKFIQSEGKLPMNLKFGTTFEKKLKENNLLVSVDGNVPFERDFYYCIGGEFWYGDFIAVRAGYNSRNDLNSGLSLGIGIKGYGKPGCTFQIDHSFVPYDKLGDTHRISVIVKF